MREEFPGREYVYALLAFFSLGCGNAVEGSDEYAAETASEIVGGIQTDLRPEIFNGFATGFHCTGTMVHKRFALTAAHCVGPTGPINPTIPIIMNGRGFPMDWAYRLGTNTTSPGATDVALVRFDREVTTVTPGQIAKRWPVAGELITMFGYGCNDRATESGSGFKRYFTLFAGPHTRQLCPGDSGGPFVFGGEDDNGEIFGVNSGFDGNGNDIFGDAVTHAAPGLAAVRKLGGTKEFNPALANFPGWAASGGVKAVSGDFNNDGCGDIMLAGRSGWVTTPFAVGNCANGFSVVNFDGGPNVPGWATQARFMLAGRFHSSQASTHSGIALVGGPGWTTLPIGWPSFVWSTTNSGGPLIAQFNTWANASGATALAGDFDANGFTDIALTGGAGWGSIPVAFSRGDGTFDVRNEVVPNFPGWAQTSGIKFAAGDFDGDGDADIAITGGAGFQSIPVAFSNRNGTFNVTNHAAGGSQTFAVWARTSGFKMVAGDFDGDGDADLAGTGPAGWITVTFAFSNRDGSFTAGNMPLRNFPGWGSQARFFFAQRMDRDSRADLVLAGGTGWTTQPHAISLGCTACD